MNQLLLICALIGQAVLVAEKSRVMAKQVKNQKLAYFMQTPDPIKVKHREA